MRRGEGERVHFFAREITACELWLRRGEPAAARLAWEQALTRFRALGAARQVGDVERRLSALAA